MTIKEIQHLYWRAGFGMLPNQFKKAEKKSKKSLIKALFDNSKSYTPLTVDTTVIEQKTKEAYKNKDKKARAEIQKMNRELIREFNRAWVDRLVNPKEILRERMTLFWANHFVVRDNRIDFAQNYNNMLRENALGNFGDFVKAMSKQAAMLKYLNNKQNVKQSPNENFARELMELFTLGKGNYTEDDIKESARAFTGYFHDIKGEFQIRNRRHDDLPKTFFGKQGNFNGDDIIDLILEEKQCARFISEKIYRYFVNDEINTSHINEMTDIFYEDYNIEKLMRFVFSSDWFYDEKNIGTKIKSPIDLLVGIQNVVPMKFKKKKALYAIQKGLGQVLLFPPNVAGWKGGKNWIDSNTIILRMRYPSVLLNSTHISIKKKGDFGDPLGQFVKRKGKKLNYFKVDADWATFNSNFKKINTNALQDFLIVPEINQGTKTYLDSLSKSSMQEYCVQLMSIPEYQMC